MDDFIFEDSVNLWCKNNNLNTKAKISTAITVLKALYIEITNNEIYKKNKINSDINDIIIIVRQDPIFIEKTFYKIFKQFRVNKKNSTILTMASISRKILSIMGMDKKRLKIPPKYNNETDKTKKNKNILPKTLKSLSNDHKLIIFINERLDLAIKNFNCNSDISKRIMLRYWSLILKTFCDINNFNVDNCDFSINNVIKIIKPIIKNNYYVIYLHHLFYKINDDWDITIKELRLKLNIKEDKVNDTDGDKDYLSVKQQEDIWKACESNLEKLIIALLFTTGLRVGGLCNIKKKDVYNEKENKIKDYGSTIEKRNKTRRFPIFDMVKKPLSDWIEQNHMIDSEFLFPSIKNPDKARSTMSFQSLFKKIAKKAGYEGPEIHIHSTRHTVARNLLEGGNNMDDIAKYLGHANPAITAKFYANLSTKESVDRMNTACIGGINEKNKHKPQIPSFYYEGKKTKKKKRKHRGLNKLANIDIGGKSIREEKLLKKLEQLRSEKKY